LIPRSSKSWPMVRRASEKKMADMNKVPRMLD
jgi:hypothetical protein